jgi:hypothetical protein
MTRFQFARLLAVSLAQFSLALPVAARAETQWFSLKGDPDYANVRAQLLVLVNIDGFHASNEFCIVGARYDDGVQALVYWPTEDMLIYWDPNPDDPEALVDSKDPLYLSHDLVDTPAEQGTSMVLMTKAYVNDIIHNCNRFGDHYHVTKSDSGWKPARDFPQFSTLSAQLQTLLAPPDWLVNSDPQTVRPSKSINRFCVIAQQDRNWLVAYVYWETEQRLILWLPKSDDDDALLISHGSLDIKNGVASANSPDSPIYQMSGKYMHDIINACRSKGENFTLEAKIQEKAK